MFVPYWYEMSGALSPCSATVAFCRAKSLFVYCIVTWMSGWVWLNLSTMALSDSYSYDWFRAAGACSPSTS